MVLVALEPGSLWSVVGSGIAITIFDRKHCLGGLIHYSFPDCIDGYPQTAAFAEPAIYWLIKNLIKAGASMNHLEAQIFGAAESPQNPNFVADLHRQNAQIGLQCLTKHNIPCYYKGSRWISWS